MRKRTSAPVTPDAGHDDADASVQDGKSRREFLKTSALGLAAAALAPAALPSIGSGSAGDADVVVRSAGPARKVLTNGIVLSLDPSVGDFERADVVIEGKKIAAIMPRTGGPARGRGASEGEERSGRSEGGEKIDCSGMIVLPGFISTHNHQYEAIQRSIIADGLIIFAGDPDQQKVSTADAVYEAYGTVVQSIWTAGRIGPATSPQWDIGRSPSDPEDNYNAELIACLSQITQGITCGTDTSQASHTPEHTDAMIEACMASGRRTLYDYSNGTDRDHPAPGTTIHKRSYDVPTSPNEYPLDGLQRISAKYFNSKDQLVTLGFAGGPTPITLPGGVPLPPPYTGMTGWRLGREFGAWINNHNVGGAGTPQTALNNNLAPFDDVTLVHCVRWQDQDYAQLSYGDMAFPGGAGAGSSSAWRIWADNGGHVSIAVLIEQQMRHGMPPMQQALNHGILPSLSPDVDTNMTPDPFSMMRGAFCLQRALANDLAFSVSPGGAPGAGSDPGNLPIPQLVTSKQVVEMMTRAGAVGSGLRNKVGTLTPGKEADIVMLEYDNVNFQPMNNVYGTIVTMMDTRAVVNVMIAGKLVYKNRKLVGWDVDKVVRNAVRSRDNALARIRGTAVGSDVGIINRGKNSGNPYRPNFLGSCCYNGQNESAPHYTLRP